MHPILSSRPVLRALAGGVIALWTLSGCGGDDAGDDPNAEQQQSHVKIGELPCGNRSCAIPEGLEGTQACCMDTFAGTCGVKERHSDSCLEPPQVDLRCAVPEFAANLGAAEAGAVVYGCCTTKNECGIGLITQFDITNPLLGALTGSSPNIESCRSVRQLCFNTGPEAQRPENLMLQTCDGEPIELKPEDCSGPIVTSRPL